MRNRHFLGAALQIELTVEAARLEPAAQGVAQQLAALLKGDPHQLALVSGLNRRKVVQRLHPHHRGIHSWRGF